MTNTPKINKAKLRRDVALELANLFCASGVEYTCSASIYRVINDAATAKAKELYDAGIVLSKSSYAFNVISCTAGMFMTDAAIIVHARKYPK